jgi:hypothetical protein
MRPRVHRIVVHPAADNPALTDGSGTVVPSPGAGGGGFHLKLTAPSGPIEVHVGPSSFVASKNVTFTKGDTLKVLGSKVAMAGQEVVIAREITKGDQVLTLRVTARRGCPTWSGTPARRRIAIIGHHPVNADWNRFNPTNRVNHRKYGCT